MNLDKICYNLLAFFLSLCVAPVFFDYFIAKAYQSAYVDAYDLYSYLEEINSSTSIYNYLSENSWIRDDVTFDEFDYILVLTQQLTYGTKVRHSLVLAQIAVESRFYQYDQYGHAYGYMQLMPVYHSKRMEKFVEEGHLIDLDDFYNPRLNIATGIDYMEELLNDSNGMETVALTRYNQGYFNGRTNNYAKRVIDLSYEIEALLTTT